MYVVSRRRPHSLTLANSSVNGTSTSAVTGQWVIIREEGTLSNTAAIPAGTPAGNATISAVTGILLPVIQEQLKWF